jgi:hypothetical protein
MGRKRSPIRARNATTLLGLVALVCAAWPAALSAASDVPPIGPGSTPGDVAASRAYLQALRTSLQTAVATRPASTAAANALVSTIGSECPQVLKGAPAPNETGLRSATGSLEASRQSRQRRRLEGELFAAVVVAWHTPERQALQTFAHALSGLQWSDQALTEAVRVQATESEEIATMAVPAVCADARAWVASGYSTLSAGTKALIKQAAARRRARKGLPPVIPLLFIAASDEKTLVAQVKKLELAQFSALLSLYRGPYRQLERELGLPVPKDLLAEPLRRPRPPKGSVVIARGRTAAGERYVARLERARGHTSRACRLSLSISRPTRKKELFESGDSVCLERSPLRPQSSVDCDAGRLTITANTLPQTRRVRLRLSNGRQIDTPVLFVPKRLGGPAGYYYQVVRGPSPIPVSLTELNAQGRAVRTVRLARVVECTKNPLKYLPGGRRTLVHETAPGGPTFSIVGERYRFLGKVYFEVKLSIEAVSTSEGEFIGGGSTSTVTFGVGPRAFEPRVETGCRPQPYTVVYGLLKARGDTVLVGTPPAALTTLRRVTIPAYLHAGGVLVYAALPGAPARLLVRRPDGRVVQDEKLEAGGTGWLQRCEREATEQKETEEEEA